MESLGKMIKVLEALQLGMEVELEGRTYVWLDNKVVKSTETHDWIIDGLAIKGRSYESGEDISDPKAGMPSYLGAGHFDIASFSKLCGAMSTDQIMALSADLALNKARKSQAKEREL